MKVLLWQTAYLGDVVLATSLLRILTKRFQKVGFVGRPFIKELLKGYDVELVPFNKGFLESFRIRKAIRSYDVVLSAHRSMRTAFILYFSGIPIRVGFDKSELAFLYTHTVPHRWGMHEVERNAQLLKPLGIVPEPGELYPKLFVEQGEVRSVIEKFQLPEEYVVLSPFSNFSLKEWYIDNWLELAKAIGKKVVVVGTEKDMERARVFDAYAIKKQEKINANFAGFILSVCENKELKNIKYPDQGFFIFKPSEGKIFTYGQVLQNLDINMYSSYHKILPSKAEVYIYTKKYNFGEYIEELLKNPTAFGIALAGLILFAIGIVYMLILQARQKNTEGKIVEKTCPQGLERKLKALRLTIATYEVIPKESIEEAKRILDDILKEMEGRK